MLGKEKNEHELEDFTEDIQQLKETFQKLIVVRYNDITVDFKAVGTVVSDNGDNVMVELELGETNSALAESAKVLQGKAVKKGEVIANGVKAPFTCKVDKVFARAGKLVASIVNYENTFVEFMLSQEHLSAIALNDTVAFGYNGEAHEGKVCYISQYVTDGAVTVRLSYDDPECKILLNAAVEPEVIIEKLENVIVVPENAITYNSHGEATVRIQRDDETETVVVECGRKVEDGVVIEHGLFDGAMIVVDITAG